MKELSLTNYKTTLSKELLKKAESNQVRECDEVKKGQYIAYVDEGNDTFDVSLTFSPDRQVLAHNCDCKNGSKFCGHKTALLAHIAKGAKTTQSVKARKKSKAEALLDAAEPADLKEWVRSLLEKNKDTELSFIHYFSTKEQQYTPDEVTKLTNEAVKAVVKNKKHLDPTQIIRVVDLWTTMHTPVIKIYLANVADEKAFVNFHTLLESCLAFNATANATSNRICKYVEGLLKQSTETINNLFSDDLWNAAINHFLRNTYDKDNVRMHYLIHLKNIISISSEARRSEVIRQLAGLHKTKRNVSANSHQFTKLLFDIMEEYGFINKYVEQFEPITYDNKFNIKLISLCINNGQVSRAKHFCQQQIASNSHQEFIIPYLQFLKEIYKIEKDDINLGKVLSTLLPSTYDYDDFLFIYNSINNPEEQKKWKSKIIARARTASNNCNNAATEFIFKLINEEKRYFKMIEQIDSQTPYPIILKYFNLMADSSKEGLLSAIINKSDNFFKLDGPDETSYFPQLLKAFLGYFTKEQLVLGMKEVSKQRYIYAHNSFVRYVLSL